MQEQREKPKSESFSCRKGTVSPVTHSLIHTGVSQVTAAVTHAVSSSESGALLWRGLQPDGRRALLCPLEPQPSLNVWMELLTSESCFTGTHMWYCILWIAWLWPCTVKCLRKVEITAIIIQYPLLPYFHCPPKWLFIPNLYPVNCSLLKLAKTYRNSKLWTVV